MNYWLSTNVNSFFSIWSKYDFRIAALDDYHKGYNANMIVENGRLGRQESILNWKDEDGDENEEKKV